MQSSLKAMNVVSTQTDQLDTGVQTEDTHDQAELRSFVPTPCRSAQMWPTVSASMLLESNLQTPKRFRCRKASAPSPKKSKGEHRHHTIAIGEENEHATEGKAVSSSAPKRTPRPPDEHDTSSDIENDLLSLAKEVESNPECLRAICDKILASMQSGGKELIRQTTGIKALHHLASCKNLNGAIIADAGGTEMLVKTGARFKDSPELQEPLCKVLRLMTICGPEYQSRVLDAGGVTTVLDAMRANSASVDVQCEGCRALKELAANNSAIQETICSQSGIELVLEAMEKHPSSPTIQEVALGVLRNMSAGNSDRQKKIAALGGVHLVYVAMGLHSQEAVVQWAGCWALFCLTHCNSQLRDEVVTSGGLPHLLHAMEMHRSASRVQEAACWAIKVLAVPGRANLALRASAAVSQAMRDHPFEEQVQKAAQLAQRSLNACSGNSQNSRCVRAPDSRSSSKCSAKKVCGFDAIPE